MEYRLGKSIAQIVPFIRHRQQQPQEDKPLITTKILVIFGIVAIIKIAVLLML